MKFEIVCFIDQDTRMNENNRLPNPKGKKIIKEPEKMKYWAIN